EQRPQNRAVRVRLGGVVKLDPRQTVSQQFVVAANSRAGKAQQRRVVAGGEISRLLEAQIRRGDAFGGRSGNAVFKNRGHGHTPGTVAATDAARERTSNANLYSGSTLLTMNTHEPTESFSRFTGGAPPVRAVVSSCEQRRAFERSVRFPRQA